MSYISDCVDALSTESYPHLVPGWPREEHYRTVVATITCHDCGFIDTDTSTGKGEFTDDDFCVTDCGECGSEHVSLHFEDKEEFDDCVDEFSRSTCDCCGTSLGGSRYAVTGLPADPSTDSSYVPYETCESCYYFIVTEEELE